MSAWASSFSRHLSILAWHWVHSLKWIHFIFKCSSSYRSTRFKYTKLLLIEYLRICKSLIPSSISKMRCPHNLLRHHKIILLRSVHSFWALNASHTIWCWLSTYCSNITYPSILSTVLFDSSRSVSIFIWHFWAISFESYHSATYSHYGRLNIIILSLSSKTLASVYTLSIRNLTVLHILSLISQSSSHHVSLCTNILSIHHNIIFFDNCYSTGVLLWLVLTCMVLLCLDNMSTVHLRILNFDLWIIKYVIVVIYILDYFNWLLILTLLFRFGRACSSLMSSWTSMMTTLRWCVILRPMALIWLKLFMEIIIVLALMSLISSEMTLISIHGSRTSIATSSFHTTIKYRLWIFNSRRSCMALFTVILENDLTWIVVYILIII